MGDSSDKDELLEKLRSAFVVGDVESFNATRDELDAIGIYGPALTGIKLKRKLKLGGINLRRAQLRDVDFAASDLSGADLREAGCREADLSGCDLTEARLKGANLKKARLLDAQVGHADFRGCNLSGTLFYTRKGSKKKARKAKRLRSARFKGASNAPDFIERFL